MSSNEQQDAMIEKQNILNLQLEKMNQKAFGTKNHAPKKPLTKVDADTIKDYNSQFKVIQYETMIDEAGNTVSVVDEEGNPIVKQKKYQSIPPPELEAVNEDELSPASLDTIEEQDRKTKEIKANMERINETILILKDYQRQNTEDLNNSQFVFNPALSPRQNMINQEEFNLLEFQYKEAQEYMQTEINNLNMQLRFLNDEVVRIHNKVHREAQGIEHNKAIISGVKQRNEMKVKEYQDALNILNKGAFQMNKLFDESEDDYLLRLQENAEIATVDESLFAAQEYARTKFKENLKELIRNPSIIESIANLLKVPPLNEEREIEIKQLINKTFPRFKTLFIELYGINNKAVTPSDIYQFILAYADNKEDSYVKSFLEVKQEKKENEKIKAPSESIFTITNSKTGTKVYFMPIVDETEQFRLLWSISTFRNTFREVVGNASYKEIKELTNIGMTEIKRLLGGNKPPSFLASSLIHKNHIKPISFNDVNKPFEKYDEKYGEELYGWGLKPEKIPEAVPFGKLRLYLHKLYYKNNLVVKNKDNSNIVGMPNIKVSDEFVKIILKILKGDKIREHDLDILKTVELHLYNRLITLADLHKKIPIENDKTIQHLKHRLELIQGEIESGNNSKELVKELHGIVHGLKNFGVISIRDATSFIKQFK